MKRFINFTKKYFWLYLAVFSLGITLFINNMSMAYTPQQLYDQVWKLVNTKYVDQTNNAQNWGMWRHKYDDKLQTDEDAYVAIDTMLASLNDPYTRFLPPNEFEEEGSAISGTLKGIGVQISVKDGKLLVISGLSGAGKGTIASELVKKFDNF